MLDLERKQRKFGLAVQKSLCILAAAKIIKYIFRRVGSGLHSKNCGVESSILVPFFLISIMIGKKKFFACGFHILWTDSVDKIVIYNCVRSTDNFITKR